MDRPASYCLLLIKRQAPIETPPIRGLLRNLQNEFVRLGRGAPEEPHPSPARAHAHDLHRPLVRSPRRLNSGTSEILEPPWITVQVENRAGAGRPPVGLDAVHGGGEGVEQVGMVARVSPVEVAPGSEVDQKSVIGLTGTTGMAGGDHLHFSVLVNGVFVMPKEWWDEHWIHDRILSKLDPAMAQAKSAAKAETVVTSQPRAKAHARRRK